MSAALLRGFESESLGAMQAFDEQLSRACWTGGTTTSEPVRLSRMTRIRWRWRALRERVARSALWLLGVEAGSLTDE